MWDISLQGKDPLVVATGSSSLEFINLGFSCSEARGILVPWSDNKPASCALGHQGSPLKSL